MRKFLKTAYGSVLAGVAGLAVATYVPGGLPIASAGGNGKVKKTSATDAGPTQYSADHQSILRLSEKDGFPVQRGVKLGQNKSMLIETSRDLRDVIVSNPDMMDAMVQTSNRVYIIGKRTGQSNVFLFDSNGDQIATIEVLIEHDTTALDVLFTRLIPGSRIKSEILNGTVILTGTVRNPADSTRASDIASRFVVQPQADTQNARHPQKVINMLQVEAEEQVMLRVQVAEVERSVLKQFGINLAGEFNFGNIATSILTQNQFPLTSAVLGDAMRTGLRAGPQAPAWGGGCTFVAEQFPRVDPPVIGSSGAGGFWNSGRQCLSHAIKALERNGLIKTLAEPNLTAISGETAKFLAGGEFPIPVSVSNGQIGITFKEFGVGVAFTPIVLSEGRINMKIETEVSELTDVGAVQLQGIGIPGLKKRQARSTVELPSGGTLAMAGLLSDDTRKNIDGFPGLKNLPVLGALFRSQDYIKRETELVVLVTPYTVRPTAQNNIARPVDGLAVASDLKSNLLGHMNRVYGKNAASIKDGGSVKDNNVGFIVD